jgi:pSer/pThr/pTyr-binding forkhead associated (FHA) protein
LYLPKDSGEMEAKLLSDNDVIVDSEFPLDKLPLVIGRSLEATLRVGDRWASRCHCEIAERDGLLVVRDLGSTHGTFLNGLSVTESTLTADDKLTVGLTTFLVRDNGHNLQSSEVDSTLVLSTAAAKPRVTVEEVSRRKPR